MLRQLATSVSGNVAAAFLSSSGAIVIIGVLTYMRSSSPWLEIYPPAGPFSGIWFYSYLPWAVIWLILYFILRRKEGVGSLRLWLIVLLVSLAITSVLVEASLNWSVLFL